MPRVTHTFSRATGYAIARTLSLLKTEGACLQEEQFEPCEEIVREISEFAELARIKLKLDNSIMANAVMFTQPLIQAWHHTWEPNKPEWKFAYLIALNLSAKLNSDGFYIADVIDHVSNEFSLQALKMGERLAFKLYQFEDMHERRRSFRNALIHVALEKPLPEGLAMQPSTMSSEPDVDPPHVLIVDDSHHARNLHRSFVLSCSPTARVRTCVSAAEAIQVLQECEANDDQIHLVLLDCNLENQCEVDFRAVLDKGNNGFDVSAALTQADTNGVASKSFCYKPLIVMITSYASEVVNVMNQKVDGSISGCDVLLPKPMTAPWMRALIEMCLV